MTRRVAIRSGRCWVPPEWRGPLTVGWFRRSAIVAVTGACDRRAARELLAAHLPLLPTLDGELHDDGEPVVQDDLHAARMARRLSRYFPAAGTRELLRAGLIPPHFPAVYAWRAARHGETVFRIAPDGSFTPIALFRVIRSQHPHGQWESELVASRPW